MNAQEAKKALRESLARPSDTPNTSNLPREEFLALELTRLEACLIEPTPISAVPSDWAVKYVGAEAKERSFLAVARSDTTWLLLNPENGEFYKAWSIPDQSEPLILLGFSSDDALTEWRG